MTVQTIPAQTVGNAVWALLGGGLNELFTAGPPNLFRGKVSDPPKNSDGTVKTYAVLYESPGHRSGSRVGATRDRWSGTFQVTCVGGDSERCLWVVDEITGRLSGRLITLSGLTRPRRIFDDASNQSRTVLEDRDVTPYRYFVPLLFRITT